MPLSDFIKEDLQENNLKNAEDSSYENLDKNEEPILGPDAPSLSEQNVGDNTTPNVIFPSAPTEKTPEQLEDDKEKEEELRQMHYENVQNLAASLFSDAEILDMQKKGKIGLVETVRRFGAKEALSLIPYAGSLVGAASSGKILDLSRRYNKGEILSTEEETQLKDYLKKIVELEVRGGTTNAGAIAQGIPEVVSFMMELGASALLTGTSLGAAAPAAAGSLAKRATALTAKKLLQRQVAGKIGRAAVYAGKGAAYTTRAAEISAAMPFRIKENYNNRRMLVEGLTLTDKGEDVFAEVEEKPFTTFMKAYGDIFTEVFAEGTGVLIGKGINYVASPVGKKIASKIPEKFTKKFKSLYAELHPDNKWSKFLTDKVMLNNFLEELGENRIAELLKVGFGVSLEEGTTIEQIQNAIFPGTDEFLVEAGLVGLILAGSTASRVLADKLSKAGNTEQFINDKFSVTPQKQLEKEANGEVKDITPNFNLEEDKSFGAVKYREGKKIASKLYETYDKEKVKEELEAADGERGWLRSKLSSLKRTMLDEFYLLRLLSPKVNVGVSARFGVPGRAMQAFDVSGPTYMTQDGQIVHSGIQSVREIRQALYEEMGNDKKTEEEFQKVGQIERLLWLSNTRGTKKQREKIAQMHAELIEQIGEERYNLYLKYAKRISDYTHALQYGEYKEGAIDEDTYYRRYKENAFYWPMSKDIDAIDNHMTAPASNASVAQSKSVSKADASLKEAGLDTEFKVENLDANLALITMRSYMLRANHQINKGLYEVAQDGTFGDFIRLPRKEDKLEGLGKVNTFEFYLDGEKKTVVISRLLVPALTDMKAPGFNMVTSLLRGFANALRKGATTYNLAYSILNPLKDQFVAYYQTDVGYIPFFDLVGGIRSYIKKDKDYVSFLASGASNSGFIEAGSVEDARKYAKKLAKKSSFLNHVNIFNWLEDISTAMEQGTRIGVFKRASGGNVLVQETLALPCEAELRQRELDAHIKEMGVKTNVRKYHELKREKAKLLTEKETRRIQFETIKGLTLLTKEQQEQAQKDYDKYISSTNEKLTQFEAEIGGMRKQLNNGYESLGKWHTDNYERLTSLYKNGWELKNDKDSKYLWGKEKGKEQEFVAKENEQILAAYKELKELNERLSNNKRIALERMVAKLKEMDPKETFEKIEVIPLRAEIFKQSQEQGDSFDESREKAGLDVLSAAFISRNATTDFATIGTVMREINAIFPFSNAQVQAWSIGVKNFKNNWASTTIKAIWSQTIFSLAALGWNLFGADDETREEWLEMPEWRKAAGINIKMFGVWWFIPRPFEYGYIFGNIPERTVENLFREDKKAASDLIWELTKGLGNAASPIDISSPLPTGILGLVEILTNYNFFKGKPIVPEFMTKLEPRYQYREDTSVTAKKIGDIFNISPMKIQNLVNTQLAGGGRDALRLFDYLINLLDSDTGEAPSRGLSGVWGLISVFRGDPIGFRSQSVTEFYDIYSSIEKRRNSYKSLLDKDARKAKEYRAKHKKELDANSTARDYRKKLQNISKEINKVKADKRYTAEEKAEIIATKEAQMTNIAKLAVKKLKQRLK